MVWSFFKKYSVSIVLFVVICYRFGRCSPVTCQDTKEDFSEHFECHMILKEKTQNGAISVFKGKDIFSGKDTIAEDGNKQICFNWSAFKVGDTIIKNKGDATIYVKTVKSNFSIPFNCN